MGQNLTLSELGLRLIKAYEGFRPVPTLLVTGQRVIGYGHRIPEGDDIAQISADEAEALLRVDTAPIEALVNTAVFAPLSQCQFDALCSLAFNIGEVAFRGSNVRRAINNGRILDAAEAFDEWRKADIDGQIYVVDALMRRRTAEKALFLKAGSARISVGRDEALAQSDGSFAPVSERGNLYDPENGVVDQAPNAKRPAQFRRREDGPLGILTLSEIAQDEAQDEDKGAKSGVRDIFSPRNIESQIKPITPDEDFSAALLQGEAQEEASGGNDAFAKLRAAFDTDEDVADQVADFGPAPIDPEADAELAGTSDLEIPSDFARAKSPIAAAAAEVSGRLDALIDQARRREGLGDTRPDPSGNFEPFEDLDYLDRPTVSPAVSPVKTPAALSAKVKGPSAYIQHGTTTKQDAANSGRAGDLRPAGREQNSESPDSESRGGHAAFMIAGGCLLAGGLVSHFTGSTAPDALLGFLVPASIVTGAVMLLGSAYYMIRAALIR